jgi:hypothetical protein
MQYIYRSRDRCSDPSIRAPYVCQSLSKFREICSIVEYIMTAYSVAVW